MDLISPPIINREGLCPSKSSHQRPTPNMTTPANTPVSLKQRRIDFYDQKYHTIAFRHLESPPKITVPSIAPNTCRFCGKNSPEVTFAKDAHAFPEMLGNRLLFADDECDSCNEYFGRTIEDHLSKFLGIQRTIAQIRGKKGIPSYKSPDQQTSITAPAKGKFDITTMIGDDAVKLDIPNKTLTITAIRPPHIKRLAYKAFVKMAISVMPPAELANLSATIPWLLKETDNIGTNSLVALHTFVSGPAQFTHITYALLKRKPGVVDVPQYSFIIAWGKFTYQIFIPFSKDDDCLLGKSITLEYFPNVFEGVSSSSIVNYSKLNMSSSELTKNEPHSVTYTADEIIENTLQPTPVEVSKKVET